MKKKNTNDRVDDKLWMKSMMESARKEPSENLSYRIMHQIEIDAALTRSKSKVCKQKGNPLRDLRVFGWMYLILIFVGGYFYMQGGKEALFTESFLWTFVTISSIFSFFFLITTIDNSLHRKQKNKPSASE